MNYRLTLMLIIIVVLLGGCTSSHDTTLYSEIDELENQVNHMKENIEKDNKIIEELLERIDELEASNIEFENMVVKQNNEQAQFISSYYLAEQFIEAYLNKDINAIRSLVSDKYSVDNEYISYEYEGQEIKYVIEESDMVYRLNSYGYEDKYEYMFYQYMVYEEPPIGVLNGFFINLGIKRIDGIWQIDQIEFDI